MVPFGSSKVLLIWYSISDNSCFNRIFSCMCVCMCVCMVTEHLREFDGMEFPYPVFDMSVKQSLPSCPHVAMWDGYTPDNGDLEEPTKKRTNASLKKSSVLGQEVVASSRSTPVAAAKPTINKTIELRGPPQFKGYLRQEGVVMKSWKKKYFVLSEGYLFSFGSEKDAELSKVNGWDPLLLTGYHITNPSKRFIKVARGDKDRIVMLDAASAVDLNNWLVALKSHSVYAQFVADEILSGRRQSTYSAAHLAGANSENAKMASTDECDDV